MTDTSGLRRGRVPGANYTSIQAQNERAQAENAEIERLVEDSPDDVILTLQKKSARVANRWLTRIERSKEEPSRNVLELLRECRQLSDRAAEIEIARSAVASRDGFFATLATRWETVEAALGGSLQPIPISEATRN